LTAGAKITITVKWAYSYITGNEQRAWYTRHVNCVGVGGKIVDNRQRDYIIIGSGAGGSTVARGTSKRKKQIFVIERGPETAKMGKPLASTQFYDGNHITLKMLHSREGVGVVRAFIGGGSTIVSVVTELRCLESEIRELGIDLAKDFTEVEQELHVGPNFPRLYSNGSRAMIEAGNDLGYSLNPMPKFIDASKCRKCGQCVFGCVHGAKWTAVQYLNEAVADGAEVSYKHQSHEGACLREESAWGSSR